MRLIFLARKYLIEESGRPKDEHIALALAFYESVLREPDLDKAPYSTKLQAQRDICTLLGLNAPTKIAPTTPDGDDSYTPIDVELLKILTAEETEVFLRACYKMRMARPGGDRSSN